jgi:hypothetical protein
MGCYTACIIVADVSVQPVGPIFNGQSVLEDGTDGLYRNVGSHQRTLRKVTE